MPERYLVIWRIDMDADSPQEAAAKALIVQRDNDPANTATVFSVVDKTTSIKTTVDLSKEEP